MPSLGRNAPTPSALAQKTSRKRAASSTQAPGSQRRRKVSKASATRPPSALENIAENVEPLRIARPSPIIDVPSVSAFLCLIYLHRLLTNHERCSHLHWPRPKLKSPRTPLSPLPMLLRMSASSSILYYRFIFDRLTLFLSSQASASATASLGSGLLLLESGPTQLSQERPADPMSAEAFQAEDIRAVPESSADQRPTEAESGSNLAPQVDVSSISSLSTLVFFCLRNRFFFAADRRYFPSVGRS